MIRCALRMKNKYISAYSTFGLASLFLYRYLCGVALEEYISTYGLESLTHTSVCRDGYKLGNWFGNCKRRYKSGNMEQRYIDRFAVLGIDLNKSRQGI